LGALHFLSGTDGQTANCGTSSLYNLQNFTFEFYFKGTNNNLWGRMAGNMGTGSQRWLVNTNDNKPVVSFWTTNGGLNVTSTKALNDNAWHHYAFTVNGAQVTVYIDGQYNASGTLPANIRSDNLPLTIGSSENIERTFAEITGVRLSNIARTDFSYGSFVNITNEPSVLAGSVIIPPASGTPDLMIVSLTAYPNPSGGILIQAVVKNQGTRETQNGFYTDLYIDHVPTGSGDYSGTVSFWVNDPIPAGGTATLTAVINQVSTSQVSLYAVTPGAEKTTTFYAQVDSTGAVNDVTRSNNISPALQICVANPDAYEDDNSYTTAKTITLGQAQRHNITSQGDQDWDKFTAQAGQTYIMTTSDLGDLSDTVMELYDRDGSTLLDSNDDYGDTIASQITWTAPASGTYYVMVHDWNGATSGCGTSYSLTIRLSGNPIYLPLLTR
jgi:hypothetical protein